MEKKFVAWYGIRRETKRFLFFLVKILKSLRILFIMKFYAGLVYQLKFLLFDRDIYNLLSRKC